jgi:FkbM family methyltransferase
LSRVSVIVPCFNAREWIRDALRSVLDQDMGDVEIIVVDDGSTDGSPEIIAREYPEVELVRSEHRGPSTARNLGTRRSTGDYIQYLDADDLLGSGKLELQLRALADTGADVVYGDWLELRPTPSGTGELVTGRRVARRIDGAPEIALFTDFWSPPAAYLFRRGIVERVGGWRADLPVIQDARFVLDCALHGGRFVYCPGEAARYRVHAGGSVSTRDPREFTRDCMRNAVSVERWWTEHGGVNPARKAALIKVYGQVARTSYDTDRPTFAAAYGALERLEPGYVPRSPRSVRALARMVGYRRAEAIASRYRQAKRLNKLLKNMSTGSTVGGISEHARLRGRDLTFEATTSRGARNSSLKRSRHFQHPVKPFERLPGQNQAASSVRHAQLRSVAGLAYRVPGVRRAVTQALRLTLQRSRLPRHTKQQLHNFFAVDVSPPGATTCTVDAGTAGAIRLRLQVRDDLSRYWYFWGYAHYELGTTQLLRRLLDRSAVFFDVGANIGYYTFLAAALLEGRGVVHAFEPWPAIFDDLAASARLNSFRCLELQRAALADRDGESPLFIPDGPEWTMASLLAAGVGGPYELVPALRFDTYCKQREIERVDVMKIDVEGAELQVLRGMGSLLSRWQPDIILEVLQPFEAELDAFFAETPYRKFRIRDTGLQELSRITADPHIRNVYLSCAPELAFT